MGQLSKGTVQRAYTLCLIGAFQQGIFGLLRAHKVNFFAERESEIRPFTITRGLYGQFSPEFSDTLEQLLSMQYLAAATNPGYSGNHVNTYRVRERANIGKCRSVLNAIAPGLLEAITSAVDQYGYLAEPDLRAKAYTHLDGIEQGATVIEGNLQERFEAPSLSDEDCEGTRASAEPRLRSCSGIAG